MTRLVVVFALMLSACSSAVVAPTATPIPTTVTLDGRVSILKPDIPVYDEVLTIVGSADVPSFMLKLIDSADQVLAQAVVQTNAGVWCIELPHHYTGELMTATLVAGPLAGAGEYASTAISLAGLEHRPDDEPFIPHQPCSN